MDYFRVVSLAEELKTLLTAHDNASNQLKILECKLQKLDQQLFTAELLGNHGNRLQLQARKSVIKGVVKMYTSFKDRKIHQVKELSTNILNSARQENSNSIQESHHEGRPPMSQPSDEDLTLSFNAMDIEIDRVSRDFVNDTSVSAITEDFCGVSRDF